MAVVNGEGPQHDRQPAYTSISRFQLRQLQLLLGLVTITSPLTATIYFPLLPLLRTHFNASVQAINLTLTVYIVFQALSPVIFGPLSDTHGRHPIFVVTLALYIVAKIGLAANSRSYGVLVGLRAIQSLGASAAYAVSFGVVADVCAPADRGRMLGPVSMALNLGACVGPIAGGAVAYASGGYAWVFWALFIVGIVLFAGIGLFLSETARRLVGDGGDRSRFKWWQLSGLGLLKRHFGKGGPVLDGELPRDGGNDRIDKSPTTAAQKYGLTTILACFRIIFYRDTFLILWLHGSFYTIDYSFVAAVPDIFKDNYNFNELQVGLAYLPRGLGIIIGSYCTGNVMDHNYRVKAREVGWTAEKAAGNDLLRFPIERARSRNTSWLLVVSTATIVGYGWAVQQRVHVAVPLALQFAQGFWGTFFYTTYSALMVDSFPRSPSTAAASTSIVRCATAAAGVAVLQPLLDVAGRGWYFTALGLGSGVLGATAVAILRWRGMEWRRSRNGISPSPVSPT